MGSLQGLPDAGCFALTVRDRKNAICRRNFLAIGRQLRKQYAKHRIARMLPLLSIDDSSMYYNLGF